MSTRHVIVLSGAALLLLVFLSVWFSPEVNYWRDKTLEQNYKDYVALSGFRMVMGQLWGLVLIFAAIVGIVIAAKATLMRFANREVLADQMQLEAVKASFAQVQDAPHTMTYAPRVSFSGGSAKHVLENRNSYADFDTVFSDLENLENNLVQPLPTYRELLEQGRIAPYAPLIFGFDDRGEAVTGSPKDVNCLGVGGGSGSGKTTSVVGMLAQCALHGSHFIVIDPHAQNEQSLTQKFSPLRAAWLCDAAATPESSLEAVQFAQEIFDRRKNGNEDCTTPVLVVIDEWNALMRTEELAAPFQKLAACLTQEGRKFNVCGIFIAHDWTVASNGNMRNSINLHWVHRTRPEVARMQTGFRASALPANTMNLDNGRYLMVDTFGEIREVQAPFVEQEDLVQLAQLLPQNPPVQPVSPPVFSVASAGHDQAGMKPERNTFETVLKQAKNAENTVLDGVPMSPEEARVVSAFYDDKKDITVIVREIVGAKSGKKYQDGLAYVNAVLRQYGRV